MRGEIIAERVVRRGLTESGERGALLFRRLAAQSDFQLSQRILRLQDGGLTGVFQVLEQTGSREEVLCGTSFLAQEGFDFDLAERRHLAGQDILHRHALALRRRLQLRDDVGRAARLDRRLRRDFRLLLKTLPLLAAYEPDAHGHEAKDDGELRGAAEGHRSEEESMEYRAWSIGERHGGIHEDIEG